MSETIKKVAETILQEPVKLRVRLEGRSRVHQLLQRYRILPTEKIISIHPVYFGTMIKISKALEEVDVSNFELTLDMSHKLVSKYGTQFAMIIAYAIVNREQDPPRRLVNFILNHFTSREMLATLLIVLRQMDVTSFMNSIISMKGMNLLKMSPPDQGSTIAPGASLEEL